jgi:hypothetical protein
MAETSRVKSRRPTGRCGDAGASARKLKFSEGEKVPDRIPKLSIHRANVLQPWGILNIDVINAEKAVKLPPDWLKHSGLSLDARQRNFEDWQNRTLALINKVLWPRYDRDRQEWIGHSTKSMHALTKADLSLMIDMQHPRSGIVHFQQLPDSPKRTLDLRPHRVLFENEDGTGIFGSFPSYDRDAIGGPLGSSLAAAVAEMEVLGFEGDFRKQDPINFRFKNNLQRPRPMQMALRFKFFDFEYKDAATSITPSMCSGHCLQGVLDGGSVLDRFLTDGVTLSAEELEAFGQWAVDIGDRRVMAGIHYPSDNICSWLLFLLAADSLYERPEVKKIIGHAIRTRSFVYRELHRWKKIGKGTVYTPALYELDQLLPPANLNLSNLLSQPPSGPGPAPVPVAPRPRRNRKAMPTA